MLNLLLKKPHTNEYLHDVLIDAHAYEILVAEGWHFSVNATQGDRLYVKIHKQKDGVRKHLWLHRWLAFRDNINPRHRVQVHHIDKNGCNNLLDNLIPLPQKDHKALHPRRKETAQ